MAELTVTSGGEPAAEEAAAIAAAAQAVIASSRSGVPAAHPAYTSEWWRTGRDEGLRRGRTVEP